MKTENSEKPRTKSKIEKVVTSIFRVSYPHLFEVGQLDKKYSITMLASKDLKKFDLIRIKKIIFKATVAQFGPDKADWPRKLLSPITDGDSDENSEREGYAGHWIIKASSKDFRKPEVIDYPKGNPITDSATLYPGCYARAEVFARYWKYTGKEGIQLILDSVQKIKDGKNLSGRKPAKVIFGAVAVDMDDDESDNIEDDENPFM